MSFKTFVPIRQTLIVFVQKQSEDDLSLLIMNKIDPVDKIDKGIPFLLRPQASFLPTFVFGRYSCYYTEL